MLICCGNSYTHMIWCLRCATGVFLCDFCTIKIFLFATRLVFLCYACVQLSSNQPKKICFPEFFTLYLDMVSNMSQRRNVLVPQGKHLLPLPAGSCQALGQLYDALSSGLKAHSQVRFKYRSLLLDLWEMIFEIPFSSQSSTISN